MFFSGPLTSYICGWRQISDWRSIFIDALEQEWLGDYRELSKNYNPTIEELCSTVHSKALFQCLLNASVENVIHVPLRHAWDEFFNIAPLNKLNWRHSMSLEYGHIKLLEFNLKSKNKKTFSNDC